MFYSWCLLGSDINRFRNFLLEYFQVKKSSITLEFWTYKKELEGLKEKVEAFKKKMSEI